MCPFRMKPVGKILETSWKKKHHKNFTVDNGLTMPSVDQSSKVSHTSKGPSPNPLHPPLGSPDHHDVVDPGAFILMPPVAVLVPA